MGSLATCTLRNEWLGGAIRRHDAMPTLGDLLRYRQIESRELLKRIVGTGYALPRQHMSHYGVDIAAARLDSVAETIKFMWAFREARTRPDARPLECADGGTQLLLQRAVLKHPKVRTPRQQSTMFHPNTRPYIFYTARRADHAESDSAHE